MKPTNGLQNFKHNKLEPMLKEEIEVISIDHKQLDSYYRIKFPDGYEATVAVIYHWNKQQYDQAAELAKTDEIQENDNAA